MKLTVLIPAHNEEEVIGDCLDSLKAISFPDDFTVEFVVVLDRCTDETKKVAEEHGAQTIEKDIRGDYISPIAEAMAYGIEHTDGDLVLKCDADVQDIPEQAFMKLYSRLREPVKRVSADSKTKSGRLWLDILFWLQCLNQKITPLGAEPRGCFTLFERRTVQEVGGFDKQKMTWDTAFDLKIKKQGWKVERVRDVIVTERREFKVRQIINHQIASGRSRRNLGVSFWRTLAHAIFRGRIFVIYGYLTKS